MTRTLGVIGGSGLYEMDSLEDVEEVSVDTTYGAPSDAIVRGRIGDTTLLFLPRHGRGHRLPPHRVNYRANILALKKLGAEQVLSVSAVGSMKESIAPGSMVVVDQFIDRTRSRANTFFEDVGVVAHVEFAEPTCPGLAEAVYRSAVEAGVKVQRGGTYVCIEGPQFSTRAESNLFRSWGVDVIGMTNLPEARLAREAELPYVTLAMATDYDCWHQSEESVSVSNVLKVLRDNANKAREIVRLLATRLPDPSKSPASTALQFALLTPPSELSHESKTKLQPLIARLLQD